MRSEFEAISELKKIMEGLIGLELKSIEIECDLYAPFKYYNFSKDV